MNILHMSLTGSIVILVVLLARMIMKKMPKKYMYLLWGIVGFRLLCPVALESSISIFNIKPIRNSVEHVKNLPLIQYGNGPRNVSETVRDVSQTVMNNRTGVNYVPIVLTAIWAAIAIGIVIYIIHQYVTVRTALRDVKQIAPGLYSGHEIDSPFVMGIIRPRIYMPAGLSRDELDYLILHEKTHIRRGDVFFKTLGLAVVVIHWFNPLVWIAYSMFVRDMEMSCDEEVIARLGEDVKVDYTMSLVSFARRSNSSKYIVVPVAFSNRASGGKEVKMRIKNVLGYKGASKLITTSALMLVAGVGLVCLFNARTFADEDAVSDETSEATVVSDEAEVNDMTDETTVQVFVDEDDNGVVINMDDESGEVTADVAETADTEASSADISIRNDNILGIDLPVLNGPEVDVELNLPAGTRVEDHPDLARFMVEGEPLASDAFSIYYSTPWSEEQIEAYIEALKNAGFTYDGYEDTNGDMHNYVASNGDGISVTLETVGSAGIYRVSFYRQAEDNAFGRVG